MSLEVSVRGWGRGPLERALKHFTQVVSASGILVEARKRRYFRPASVERKRRKAIKLAKSRRSSEESGR